MNYVLKRRRRCKTCRYWKGGKIIGERPEDVPSGFGTCRSNKIRPSYILEELERDGLYLTIDEGDAVNFMGKDFCCCHWEEIENE